MQAARQAPPMKWPAAQLTRHLTHHAHDQPRQDVKAVEDGRNDAEPERHVDSRTHETVPLHEEKQHHTKAAVDERVECSRYEL